MDGLDEHFVLTLSAPRKSGKTFFINTLLKSDRAKAFDHIFILCPSSDLNTDYDEISQDPRVQVMANVSPKILDHIFETQAECMRKVKKNEARRKAKQGDELVPIPELRCPHTLVILDDCIDSGLLDFRGVADKYAERGRHAKLSSIFSGQRQSAFSRSIRLNADYFLIFSPFSIGELEKFIEEFVSRSLRGALRDELLNIFAVPHQFLLLDNSERDPRKKLKVSTADAFFNNKFTVLDLEEIKRKLEKNKRQRANTPERAPTEDPKE
jgi:hypothetical protein